MALRLLFDIASDKLSDLLRHKHTSADHRIFKALHEAAGPGADKILHAELLKRSWPLTEGVPQGSPSEEYMQKLSNNFAIFSSLRLAGSKPFPEVQLRDNLADLATQENYKGIVAYMRDHVDQLEEAAAETARRPRHAIFELK
jgi:hypothetical protein